MKRVLKWLGPVIGFALFLLDVILFSGPKDLIGQVRDYATDLGIALPAWWDGSHERQIVRVGFQSSLFVIAVLLIWPLVAGLIALTHRRVRLITTVGQISRKIPKNLIPSNPDGWNVNKNRINAKLRVLLGRPARLDLMVERSEMSPDGRYKGVPRIVAQRQHLDAVTGLPIYLYTYFDRADADLIRHVLLHAKNDPVVVKGVLSRADVEMTSDRFKLNIDLSYCTIA